MMKTCDLCGKEKPDITRVTPADGKPMCNLCGAIVDKMAGYMVERWFRETFGNEAYEALPEKYRSHETSKISA